MPLLLNGETGSGKEASLPCTWPARARTGVRRAELRGDPETLIESELFGYRGGSFTGARKGGHARQVAAG